MFSKKSYLGTLILALFIFAAFLLSYFESHHESSNIKNIWDALWYALITLTTVGYGDYYPISFQGKIIALIFVTSSLGVLGYLISSLTNKLQLYMEHKRYGYHGSSFEEHFVIFGWDKFGQYVTDQIIKTGYKVAIITNDKEDFELLENVYPKEQIFMLFSDYNNFELIKKANITKASSVFINFSDDTETLVYLINLKKHFPDTKFVVSLENPDLKETYKALGTTYTISKNEIASKLVASYIFEPDVASLTEDIMSTSTDVNEYDIQEYLVTEDNPYLNREYVDSFISIKQDLDCILLGISKLKKEGRQLLKNPPKGTIIEQGDYLILISNGHSKSRIEASFGTKEGRKLEESSVN